MLHSYEIYEGSFHEFHIKDHSCKILFNSLKEFKDVYFKKITLH